MCERKIVHTQILTVKKVDRKVSKIVMATQKTAATVLLVAFPSFLVANCA